MYKLIHAPHQRANELCSLDECLGTHPQDVIYFKGRIMKIEDFEELIQMTLKEKEQ